MTLPHAPGLNVPCPHCQQVHTRCIGHRDSKTDGHVFPCGRFGSDGANACYIDGGPRSSKRRQQARRAAIKPRAKAIAQVIATVKALAIPVETSPVEALIQELAQSAGLCNFFRERFDDLIVPEGGELVTDERLSMHPYYAAWRDESERKARLGELLLRAGVEEREVRAIEQQTSVIADLMRRILDHTDLGLTEAQRQIGRRIAATQLRLVSGGGSS